MALKSRYNESNKDKTTTVLNHIRQGSVLGTIECSHLDFTNTSMEQFGSKQKLYVGDLAVREDARRAGIASKLLEIVEKTAKERIYSELYLHVENTNEIALKFYQKRFFKLLNITEDVLAFTKSHLTHRPPESYFMLMKEL